MELRNVAALATVTIAMTGLAGSASAADPALTVEQSKLDSAIKCAGPALSGTRSTPVLIVSGTGSSGDDINAFTGSAFSQYGHPYCWVNFPYSTTGDIQISAQYLVNAIRREHAQSGRKLAVFGISQGGLLPRWALTWWPSLRSKVDDVIAIAGTQHGSDLVRDNYVNAGCATHGCAPSVFQQSSGSNLIKALDAYPTQAPGPTSWTTIRSTSDEVVTPQSGSNPASSLKGASNILIQSVCKGRKTSHVGTLVDSVTWAALFDAVSHSGPAKTSRFPKTVCALPFGPGIDAGQAWVVLAVASHILLDQLASVPLVTAEPPVASYARR